MAQVGAPHRGPIDAGESRWASIFGEIAVMTTNEANRRAPCAGEAEGARTDVALRPIIDAEPSPGLPPVAPIVVRPQPTPPKGRGLAVPLFHTAVATLHIGGDERDQAIGLIYAAWALYHLLTEE